MKGILKITLLVVIISLISFVIFEVYVSSPYLETDIYQITERTQFGEEVITSIISPDKMIKIISDVSKELSLSSIKDNFPVKVEYKKGGSDEWGKKETFNNSEAIDFTKNLIYEYNQDGLIEIIGNDTGFAVHDRDFFIYYKPKDRDKIVSILNRNGLKEKNYLVKSYYPHFHFIKFHNKEISI